MSGRGAHSDSHRPSAAALRREKRRLKQQAANRRPENFGKINWRAYTHRQLWDMVKSADTARMADRTHAWKKLADEIDQATAEARRIVQELATSWRGPSAVLAAESAERLAEWARETSGRAYTVGGGLDAYTWAVQEAAQRMPEPVHPDAERWFRDGYDVTTLDGPQGAYMLDQLLDDHMPSKAEQRAAMAEAVRVMEEYEDASRGVHTRLPTFEHAPEVARIEPDHRPVPQTPLPHPAPHPSPVPWPTPTPTPTPVPDTSSDGTTSVAAAGVPAGVPGAVNVPGGYGAHGGVPGGVP
ncbi:PPE domain-containing protein, partial [Saccharothrix hoggarensis]